MQLRSMMETKLKRVAEETMERPTLALIISAPWAGTGLSLSVAATSVPCAWPPVTVDRTVRSCKGLSYQQRAPARPHVTRKPFVPAA